MNDTDSIKIRLKGILSNKRGRESAITRRELSNYLGYQNDRQLRLIIAELRSEGSPILSATNKPAGYYVPATWDELREGLDLFKSYIIDLCVQRARIKKAGERSLYSGKQGVLI